MLGMGVLITLDYNSSSTPTPSSPRQNPTTATKPNVGVCRTSCELSFRMLTIHPTAFSTVPIPNQRLDWVWSQVVAQKPVVVILVL